MDPHLPALRGTLDIMPSPVEERPGLLMRDPLFYTEQTVIVPPLLARALRFFDGRHSESDLRRYLTQATGDLQVTELARHLVDALESGGFLESATYFRLRDAKHKMFAESPIKEPAHAGSAYPAEPEALREQLKEWGMASPDVDANHERLAGIAAPHVSPIGGYQSYAAAYRRLQPEHAGKTFVILGTSHYGEGEKWGLTRKAYRTPLGPVETDQGFIDDLVKRAGDSVVMEDYCHASEHSIEFQSVYLQHVLGGLLPEGERLRAVPILCGGLGSSLYEGLAPERDDSVRRFFDALRETSADRGTGLIFVLGIDLAHIGSRYGDSQAAIAEQGPLAEVRRRDEERLAQIAIGSVEGYYDLMLPTQDDLRWCGHGPLYTFLVSTNGLYEGRVLSYEQWNIDAESVVSFTGMEFRRPS
jgi:AmmeMemoRadiSam system protein B